MQTQFWQLSCNSAPGLQVKWALSLAETFYWCRSLWARTIAHICWGVSNGLWEKDSLLPEPRKGKNEEATEYRLLSSRLFWQTGLTTFYMLSPEVSGGRKAGVKQVPKAAGGLWPALGRGLNAAISLRRRDLIILCLLWFPETLCQGIPVLSM